MRKTFLRFIHLTLLFAAGAHAGAGSIDTTFGNGGVFTPPLECCGSVAAAGVAVQADGKVVIGGFAQYDRRIDALIIRENTDGSLDPTFGSGGLVRVPVGSSSSEIRSIAIQPDGRIVATGFLSDAGVPLHSFVLRLDTNGQLDAGFGAGGISIVGPLVANSPRTSVRRVLLQSNGGILLAGGVAVGSDADMFLARLGANGVLDASFGSGGVVRGPSSNNEEAQDAAIAVDGKIWVVGKATIGGVAYGAAMRVLPTGQLDTSFGPTGFIAPVVPGFPSDFRAIAARADGTMLVGGIFNGSGAVLRLSSSGTLDATYANAGVRFFGGGMVITRIAALPAEAPIVLVSAAAGSGTADLTIHRLGPDGATDPSWTTLQRSGLLRDGRSGDVVQAAGVAVLANNGLESIGVVRSTVTGSVDPSFTSADIRPGLRMPEGQFPSIAVDPIGAMLVIRDVINVTRSLTISKVTPHGRLETAFGGSGNVQPEVVEGSRLDIGLRLAAAGKMLFTTRWLTAPELHQSAIQLNADGSRDTGFANPHVFCGHCQFHPRYVVPYADGRFLWASTSGTGRYLSDGSFDPSFNFGQPATGAIHAAVLPDGGYAAILANGAQAEVRRVAPNGGLMAIVPLPVGTSGTNAIKVAVGGDGKIVVMGAASDAGSGYVFAARLLPDFTFDPQFGSGGIVRLQGILGSPDPTGLALQSDGAVLIAGNHSGSRGFVIRLTPQGLLDGGFGQTGVSVIDTSTGAEVITDIGIQPDGGIVASGSSNGTPAVFRLFGTSSGPGSTSAALVSSYYRSILGRNPESAGQAFWEGELTRVTGLGASASETFYVMATVFFGGAEYALRNTNNAQFLTDLYRTFFNREPDAGGMNFWLSQLASGRPRDAVLNEFLFSQEFSIFMTGLFGSANTSAADVSMVMDFYRGLHHRLPDSGGMNFWLGRLRDARCSGTVAQQANAISSDFINSTEYANRQATFSTQSARDAAFVLDLYSAFMRRGADLSGFNHYTSQLASGAMTREAVRLQFVSSTEFQARVNAVQAMGCR